MGVREKGERACSAECLLPKNRDFEYATSRVAGLWLCCVPGSGVRYGVSLYYDVKSPLGPIESCVCWSSSWLLKSKIEDAKCDMPGFFT